MIIICSNNNNDNNKNNNNYRKQPLKKTKQNDTFFLQIEAFLNDIPTASSNWCWSLHLCFLSDGSWLCSFQWSAPGHAGPVWQPEHAADGVLAKCEGRLAWHWLWGCRLRGFPVFWWGRHQRGSDSRTECHRKDVRISVMLSMTTIDLKKKMITKIEILWNMYNPIKL